MKNTVDPAQFKRLVLEKDDSAKNQHKFYIISKTDQEDHFQAAWGRKGKPAQGRMEYSYADIKKKLQEKLNKGYVLKISENENSEAYLQFLEELGDGWDLPD